VFRHILDRGVEAVFTPQNLEHLISHPGQGKSLLRTGRIASLINGGPHPYQVAQNAQRVLAAVALAFTDSPDASLEKFEQLELVPNPSHTLSGLQHLYQHLTNPAQGLVNLYLHSTFACPLHCTHCYAGAESAAMGAMPVADIIRLTKDAARLGFRHSVITGGEPLVHPQRDALLDGLCEIRQQIKPLLTVLRTNLVMPLDHDLLHRLAVSTDEVVVSVDGDEQTHDARRGVGTYARTIENLHRLVAYGLHTDLSLACVLPTKLANGAPGDSVRQLAKELGLRRTRFRPVLPLGRAPQGEPGLQPEAISGNTSPDDLLRYGFQPVQTCGLGQNLYVEPDGSAYPCYAWHPPSAFLGNLNQGCGLPELINSSAFQRLDHHTVNTNHRCQACSLRYLCGGACRAWNQLPPEAQLDLDIAPLNCTSLFQRARGLFLAALEYLEITPEQWLAAGLPLPELGSI
ncbi:MAG TPA: radical SAM protein, partial [Anaerolineales bacterium]|nr:radical SAM protein [Anaerolineales bacterium]